ncbi:MAG: FkbM family methyltransferase [Terracidiphilus sp.]
MRRIFAAVARVGGGLRRQKDCFVNGLRFGVVYLRARWFKMPRKIHAAGKSISLQYPPEVGVETDFIGCFIRNEYGLRRRLADVRTIVDVGANAGFFSVAARGRYPRATIHAYEPNPRVLPFLNANVSELGIRVFPEAVGISDGFASIEDDGPSNLARTHTSGDGGIPMVGFEKAIQRIGGQVDLLKLDCEGAEWDLFQSAHCWRNIRNLRMEYHLFHRETFAQVDETLRGLGFKIIHTRHEVGFGILWATRLPQLLTHD